MMKVAIALFAFVALSFALSEKEYQDAFTSWMRKHQKSYHHDEFIVRYRIFKHNLDHINEHNAKGTSTMTLGLNQMSDLTNAEYRKFYLGFKVPSGYKHISAEPATVDVSALPTSMNWTAKGAVTPVKNQQQCGSCWSFSTTGSTEGCHQIKTGQLIGLSEQNLMDCSTAQGNQGCNGGMMTDAMTYIIQNKGIDTEASYPYTAEDGTSCHYTTANKAATLSSFTNVVTGSESDLQSKSALGPVSVAIDASQPSFQSYAGGVYDEPACSTTQLDHGVLVVGYGELSGKPYWIVKNSWGATEWGINGYILMSRNKQNQCGIATMATLPHC